MDISVIGRGSADAAPDIMRLNAGVEVRGRSAAEAFAGARAAAARLAEALRGAGIAAHDLRTTEVSLGPEYEAYPKVSSYRAAQGVEAVIRDLARADHVIDTVAGVGEEARLNGIAFEVSDPDAAMATAREAAFRQAEARAAQLAGLAGRPLGRVVSISEEDLHGPPVPMMRTMAAEAHDSISPGRQTTQVTVRVGYVFGD
ncbi:SIMPL domain-containing protein [Nonomuraea sp. NPDC048826]|uniref:SIMPL domain-containing protein n=1 Tax=Nonomuraea sp. NPDC048826 TaxID=3364347 RepID=UPI003717855C